MKQLFKNFFYTAFYQIIVLLIPLVTVPYIARILGPTRMGINTYTNAVTQYFVLLSNLGLTFYGQREVAYYQNDIEKRSQVFFEIEIVSVCSSLFAILCFLIFLKVTATQYFTFFLAQGILLLAQAFDISWFFSGMEKFKFLTMRNLLVKILSLILIFTFVKTKSDLLLYIVLVSGSMLVGNMSLWPLLKKYLIIPQNIKPIKRIGPAISLFIPQVAITIYSAINKVFLGQTGQIEQAGFFDGADKIVRMAVTVLMAVSTVMLPRIASSYANDDDYKVKKYVELGFKVSALLAFPMTAGLVAIAPTLIPWFLGKKFLSVIVVVQIEAIAMIPIALANITGNQILVPTNHVREYTVTVVIGSVVSLVINYFLISNYGAIGAALSTVISETIVAIGQLYYANRIIKISKIIDDTWKIVLSSILMLGSISFIKLFPFSTPVVALGVLILSGIIIYLFMLILLREKMTMQILEKLYSLKVKHRKD